MWGRPFCRKPRARGRGGPTGRGPNPRWADLTIDFILDPPSLFADPPLPSPSPQVSQPPTDGVSSLSWSPRANLLVATSWDNQVRCWDVQQNGQAIPKASQTHQAPVLCSAWHGDGSKIFSAGCDNQVKMWDLQSNQQQQVAAHDASIRRMAYISELNMLVTGGWDRTLRYWDLRSPNAVHVHQLPEKCYALSLNFPLLVVGTAERHIEVSGLISSLFSSPTRHLQSRDLTQAPQKKDFQPSDRASAGLQEGDFPAQVPDEDDRGLPEQDRVPRRIHRGQGRGPPRGGKAGARALVLLLPLVSPHLIF